jgi:hypothetical protein
VPISSLVLEAHHLLKATAGNLLQLDVLLSVPGYVMIFDSAVIPADGAVLPKFCWASAYPSDF